VAARWDLPPVLADAISLHHTPALPGAEDPALVALVAAVDQVTALLRDSVSLDPGELPRATLVAEDERSAILQAVEALPEFVASFESAEAWKPAPRSLVAPEPVPARNEGPPPPAVAAVLTMGGRRVECRFVVERQRRRWRVRRRAPGRAAWRPIDFAGESERRGRARGRIVRERRGRGPGSIGGHRLSRDAPAVGRRSRHEAR